MAPASWAALATLLTERTTTGLAFGASCFAGTRPLTLTTGTSLTLVATATALLASALSIGRASPIVTATGIGAHRRFWRVRGSAAPTEEAF